MSNRLRFFSPMGRAGRNQGATHAPVNVSRRGGARRRGFTMVELLVVIGIITLLISILLPALSKARQAAYVVRWKSYVHQLALDPNVVAIYDFQVDNADMAADGNGNISNAGTLLENKAIGDPSDRLSTTPSNLNGTFAGNITGNPNQNPAWVQGRWKGKGALKFTSTLNQFVDCGAARDWKRIKEGLTICAWFKPVDATAGAIVGRELGPTHVNPWYSWLLYNGGLKGELRTDTNVASSSVNLRRNDWNFIVGTYGVAGSVANTWGNIYQDGLKQGFCNAGINNTIANTRQTVRIGAGGGSSPTSATTPPDPLNGVIDEIIIYNKVMPDYSTPFNQEIDKLFYIGDAAQQK